MTMLDRPEAAHAANEMDTEAQEALRLKRALRVASAGGFLCETVIGLLALLGLFHAAATVLEWIK